MTQELAAVKRKIRDAIWENARGVNVYEMREILQELAYELNESAVKMTSVPDAFLYANGKEVRKRVKPL